MQVLEKVITVNLAAHGYEEMPMPPGTMGWCKFVDEYTALTVVLVEGAGARFELLPRKPREGGLGAVALGMPSVKVQGVPPEEVVGRVTEFEDCMLAAWRALWGEA